MAHRKRRIVLLLSALGGLLWWRDRKMAENEQQLGPS